jgi:hypothetical protein
MSRAKADQSLSLAIFVRAHLLYLFTIFAAKLLRRFDREVTEQGFKPRISSLRPDPGVDNSMLHDQISIMKIPSKRYNKYLQKRLLCYE